MAHKVLITGAAGYVGTMLVRRFAARADVEAVIAIDKEPMPDILKKETKLVYLNVNTIDDWEPDVAAKQPDIVIHAAWQIREIYGGQDIGWRWNIHGSDKVFEFAFNSGAVQRLIHFSTVASYGALKTNSTDHYFTEDEPFRESAYRYAEEKRIAEERLSNKYEKSDHRLIVSVVRPVAITGPRGRFMHLRFGLQSALAGSMKGSLLYSIVSALVAFVPITPKWLRQFVHEDDVVNIVEKLSFDPVPSGCQAFNLCPPGAPVLGKDFARAVGKRQLPVSPWMVRIAFFVFWHLTRGRIPTATGVWKGYSYPIAVDGGRITRVLGYRYRYTGPDAFRNPDGDYEPLIPESIRHQLAHRRNAPSA